MLPPPAGVVARLLLTVREKTGAFCACFYSNRIRVFKVTIITETTPASAPSKTKIFAKLAKRLPEPQRDFVAPDAMEIDVKRLTGQMKGPLREREPSSDEFGLFRPSTDRRCDLKRITGVSSNKHQIISSILYIRRQCRDMAECSVGNVRHIRKPSSCPSV